MKPRRGTCQVEGRILSPSSVSLLVSVTFLLLYFQGVFLKLSLLAICAGGISSEACVLEACLPADGTWRNNWIVGALINSLLDSHFHEQLGAGKTAAGGTSLEEVSYRGVPGNDVFPSSFFVSSRPLFGEEMCSTMNLLLMAVSITTGPQ